MAIQIRVSPDDLHSAAADHRSIAASVDNACQTLSYALNLLKTAWHGNSGAQAAETLAQIRSVALTATNCIEAAAYRLVFIANAFQQADSGLTSSGVEYQGSLLLKHVNHLPDHGQFHVSEGIYIVPADVRQAASLCANASNMFLRAAESIDQVAQGLQSNWRGRAYQRYREDTKYLSRGLVELSDKIGIYSRSLQIAAIRFEEMDKTMMDE